MDISPFDIHNEAYNMISTTISGAKEYGLDINTLPPHLSIMTANYGADSILLGFSMPDILQDVSTEFWAFMAHQKLSEIENSIGFVFWCLLEDEMGIQSIYGLSYFKGHGFSGFLSDPNFQQEPVKLDDPHSIVPSFIHYDYEQEYLVH